MRNTGHSERKRKEKNEKPESADLGVHYFKINKHCGLELVGRSIPYPSGPDPEHFGRCYRMDEWKIKIKSFFHLALKTFVNDCSLGLMLIIIGFICGMCFISLLKSFQNFCRIFGL